MPDGDKQSTVIPIDKRRGKQKELLPSSIARPRQARWFASRPSDSYYFSRVILGQRVRYGFSETRCGPFVDQLRQDFWDEGACKCDTRKALDFLTS